MTAVAAHPLSLAPHRRVPSLHQIRAEQCRRHLSRFIREFWHVLEPGRPLVWGWHLDAICEHLEAVERGEIRDLVINIPPRCMKSLSVAVFWPVWCWIRSPEKRFIFTAYAMELSRRDNRKRRQVIEHPHFSAMFPGAVELSADQNVKHRIENTATGLYFCTGVEGANTGEGGDFVVADDPHNAAEGESDLVRESTVRWWDEVMTTRLNDQDRGGKLIIMQRVHAHDLAGHVLKEHGYEHLMLPMEFEPDRRCSTSIGFVDPRAEEGELLWPERFTPAAVERLKQGMGGYAAAGQLQQRPAPREGAMLAVQKLRRVALGDLGQPERRIRYWDKAGTAGGGDYTCGALVAKYGENGSTLYVLEDLVFGQWEAGRREAVIRATAERDGPEVTVWHEQEPGSGGKESAERTTRELTGSGFPAYADKVTGSKEVRAEPLAAIIEAGGFAVVEGDWLAWWLDQAQTFPACAHKDPIDATAGAFNKLSRRMGLTLEDIYGPRQTEAH